MMFLLYFLLILLFFDVTVDGTPLGGPSMLPGNQIYPKLISFCFILDNRLYTQSIPCNITRGTTGTAFYFIFTDFHTELLAHNQDICEFWG